MEMMGSHLASASIENAIAPQFSTQEWLSKQQVIICLILSPIITGFEKEILDTLYDIIAKFTCFWCNKLDYVFHYANLSLKLTIGRTLKEK